MSNPDARTELPLTPKLTPKLAAGGSPRPHDDFWANDPTSTQLVMAGLSHLSAAWAVVEQYLAGAQVQMARFVEGRAEAHRRGMARDRSWSSYQRQAFVDLHGYFTCWRQVGGMLGVIAAGLPSKAVKIAYRPYRAELRRYGDARDHLEHFDERLRGTRKGQPLTAPGDLGNLDGDEYTFNGERWDVSPTSLQRLLAIVDHFEGALRIHLLEEIRSRSGPGSGGRV